MRGTASERFWAKVDRRGPAECWPWLGMRRGLYGAFYISCRESIAQAHRVAFRFGHRTPLPGEVIRHLCNRPLCCNPRHLRAGTQADNIRDKVVAGRQAKGTKNGRAKLTENQAREIFHRLAAGHRVTDLAGEFGVTRRAVRFIRDGKNWKHIHATPRQTSLVLVAEPGGAS